MKALIERLTQTPGPSGYENQIRELIHTEIEPLADEVRVDKLGNLIARKGEKGKNGKCIMLAAHMDEIGIIATHIDKNGFVRFTSVGGVAPRYAPGGRVRFLDGSIGVINTEKITKRHELPSLDKMFIDVGAANRNECPIEVGDVAAFERPFTDLGNRLISKAMDDRIGVAVIIEALRQLEATAHEIHFVFSTQEEVGLRGATTAAFSVDPDLGLSVDVTGTGDTPKSRTMDVGLGKGPAIKVKDSGMLADPRIVDWMVSTAEEAEIPHQLEVLERGTTDARAMQLNRAGVPAGCLSIPCRYVHSPSEMVDYNDVKNAVRLLISLLSGPITLF
ncbi:MAG: M42 family metallopeptidase [Chloroflexota bacterium]|nr:M42 family metallopeptidase [Chloroflexota bacterium]